MRFWLFGLLTALLLAPPISSAQAPANLTAGEFFEQLALRSPDRFPRALAFKPNAKVQVALVIDATTSMEQEIASLAQRLPSLGKIFSPESNGTDDSLEWSVVLYRDAESPSKEVTLLERGINKTLVVTGELRGVKVETAGPDVNNAIDIGLHEALTKLSWKKDAEKHIVVIGDSPAYGGSSEFRKHLTPQLLELAKTQAIRIHAIHPATTPTDPSAAAEMRRLTNLFYSLLTSPSDGFQIDLANRDSVEECLGRAIRIEKIDPALLEKLSDERLTAESEKEAARWKLFAQRYARSVQQERELSDALQRIWKTDSSSGPEFASEVTNNIKSLESLVTEIAKPAPLHLQISLAYDRIAPLGVFSQEAAQRAWHAQQARRKAAADQETPESVAKEIEAWAKFQVEGDPQAAGALFDRVIELADETTNPGAVARAHAACLRLALIGETPSKESAARTSLEYLLKLAPATPFTAMLRARLHPAEDQSIWLHEDQLHAAY